MTNLFLFCWPKVLNTILVRVLIFILCGKKDTYHDYCLHISRWSNDFWFKVEFLCKHTQHIEVNALTKLRIDSIRVGSPYSHFKCFVHGQNIKRIANVWLQARLLFPHNRAKKFLVSIIGLCSNQECSNMLRLARVDGKIFTKKRERISKNRGGNPEWAKPTRDCPRGFWIFSQVFE